MAQLVRRDAGGEPVVAALCEQFVDARDDRVHDASPGLSSSTEVATNEQATSGLPDRVQEALGELAGVAKEGLLALSVGVGLVVLHEIMEAEIVRSSARRASTTQTGLRCVTAATAARSRSADVACQSRGRVLERPMVRARSS